MDLNGTTRLAPARADVRMSGRIAVVTGASRGLGQAIAVRLARAGAALAVTARNTAALAATVRQLAELGVTGVAYATSKAGVNILTRVLALEWAVSQASSQARSCRSTMA